MSSEQDEIKDIVAQLQRLHAQESELLPRLERLSVTDRPVSRSPTPTRDFRLGGEVSVKNPKPFQIKRGFVVRIGTGTDHIAVQSKNGIKIVRASFNLTLIA